MQLPIRTAFHLMPSTTVVANKRKKNWLPYRLQKPKNSSQSPVFYGRCQVIRKQHRQLLNLLETVLKFIDDMRMDFGLDKCNILNMLKGKLIPSEDITLSSKETIKALDIRD